VEGVKAEVLEKIISKLMGQAYVRYLEYKKPIVTIPEFKFMIGTYRIKKSNWYHIAKHLQDEGYIHLRRNNSFIVILSARQTDIAKS
jgi:hypothetical protein